MNFEILFRLGPWRWGCFEAGRWLAALWCFLVVFLAAFVTVVVEAVLVCTLEVALVALVTVPV